MGTQSTWGKKIERLGVKTATWPNTTYQNLTFDS